MKGDEVFVRYKFRIGNGELLFDLEFDFNVVYIRFILGFLLEVFRVVVRVIDGIVFEGYGVGGILYRGRNFLEVVFEIVREKLVVMMM